MPSDTATPHDTAAITPAFLSEALGEKVLACDFERIGEEEGFTGGGLYRVSLRYGGAVPGRGACDTRPATLVAKLSPEDPGLRAMFAASNAREVSFYQTAAGSGALPVPHCFHASFDAATGASLLLIDDLRALRAVPYVVGCTKAEAEQVVDAMAQVHAQFWDAPEMRGRDGTELIREFDLPHAWALYPDKVAALLPQMVIPQPFLDLCACVAGNVEALFGGFLKRGPLTLTHRDLHVDNVLFDAAEGKAKLIDWQLAGPARGTCDLSNFLISSLPVALRRKEEASLLRRYHDALIRGGVRNYAIEDCRFDYRQCALSKLFVTVVATTLLDNDSASKRAYREADLTRLVAFCEDHDLTAESLATLVG
ncbi:ecdysteroid 22-kinase family protein [Cognatishimia sp. F0-27]|uniref:ecdysteroid 22-kinase family protein n=1 Tax=Cognatishimia sp. F0-27 TaxID=2816855 RepID=UPI001D0C5A39|nr:ecdysteroid 22-kinase family protein [Cognatishimia sp. F0-27]MCC1491932.1 phosphotransferase [Cognatishimia sp. F0-27]